MQRSGSSHGFGGRTAAAFAVHIFTACGAACALLALLAAAETRWRAMFLWLGVALIIDGTDGPSRDDCASPRCCRAGQARCSISSSTS
jgi:phosphatidylcholine synthase